MNSKRKLIIFGDSAFGQIAYEYFTHDSDYEVAAFTVDREYLHHKEMFGLPIVPFDEVEKLYSKDDYDMHIALVYNTLNRVRMKKYEEAKRKGYELANYISSRAFVWHNVQMGDNNFIFEDNTVQPFVSLGSNIVLWSGNHIGHHSVIKDHCFISSHVVISGFCEIGTACFMGVNSTIGNNIVVGDDCLIGAGTLIVKNVPSKSLIKGSPSQVDLQTTHEKFGIAD